MVSPFLLIYFVLLSTTTTTTISSSSSSSSSSYYYITTYYMHHRLACRTHTIGLMCIACRHALSTVFCCHVRCGRTRTGIVCAGGSDAPVELPQPLLGIYDAIYRPAASRLETAHQFKLVKLR